MFAKIPRLIAVVLAVSLIASIALNVWQYRKRAAADASRETPDRQRISSLLAPRTSAKEPGSSRAEGGKGAAPEDRALTRADGVAPLDRMLARIEQIKNLPAEQIEDMLAELRAGGDDPERRFLAHLLLTRWGQEDPEAAFASLGALAPKRNGGEASSILAGLAASNPLQAAAWLTDPANDAASQPWLGHTLARTLAAEWSRQDPDAALAWASALEPGELQTGAYAGIVSDLLQTDPERAAAVATGVEPSVRPKLLGQVAATWGRQVPEAALDWAANLEGADRRAVVSEALSGWAETAPASAAAYLDSLSESERGLHVGSVARSWAEQAPAQAAEWLGSQPESAGKAESMGHVMWNWTSADPEAASAWLAEQPPGESFDHGATGLAKAATHAFDDPEAGVAWSAAITDETLRARMTRHTLQQWMERDSAAAQAWARENGVETPAPGGAEGGK